MKLDAYMQPIVFDELRDEWNSLLHQSAADDIFLTWEWQYTWWSVYEPGDLFIVTCRDDSGSLVGLAPWFIDAGRTLRTVGCEDVTDYLDLIVRTSNEETVYEALAAFLQDHRDRFDSIAMCNIPEKSATLTRFVSLLGENGFDVKVERNDVCPLIQLPSTWDDYLGLLDKKQRHELRRKMRRARGGPNEMDWYIVDQSYDLDAEIARFLKLMAASDGEKAAFLENPANMEFFKQMIPLMHERGWLRLNFLTIDGDACAAYLNFEYNERVLVYNSGFALDVHGALSPGIILLAHNIRDAIDKGLKVFDFLRGDETYKYHMGGRDTQVMKLQAS
ncbi:MAG: GNAT family N-acetyltransferase [Chloroflexota bacterium]